MVPNTPLNPENWATRTRKAYSPVASEKARAACGADAASRHPQGGLLLAPSGPKNGTHIHQTPTEQRAEQ